MRPSGSSKGSRATTCGRSTSARFGDYAAGRRTPACGRVEVYRREYDIHYPEEERPAGRPLKTGPLYDRLATRGAVFGARFGWERPLWFAEDGRAAEDAYSFRRGNWLDAVGEECRAVRSAVGVLDQTSFAKYEVSGPGAEQLLDRLCANRLPAELGRMCAHADVYAAAAASRPISPSPGSTASASTSCPPPPRRRHDLAWIQAHAPDDGSVRVENVTARYGVLTLAGPRSRELLQSVTSADVGREAFPFFRCRELEAGMAPVLALRVSFVGELGFELHHPVEYQRHLYDDCCSRQERRSDSSTSATARSSRCVSRSATGSGAPTCPPTGRRSWRGSSAS